MKYNLKLIILIIILLSSYLGVFADTSLDLKTSSNKVSMDNTFKLSLEIKTTSTGSIKLLGIEGLNNFSKLGQQSYNSFSNINGKESISYVLNFNLKPIFTGNFNLGPVKVIIGEEEFISNVIPVNVIGSKINIATNNIKEINKDKSGFGISDIKESLLGVDSFIFYLVFIIFLLLLLYFYTKRIENNKKSRKKKKIIHIDTLAVRKKKLIKEIKSVEKIYLNETKTLFYGNLNTCFREYFNILGIDDYDILTLKELKELEINKNILNLFEKSYINEFSNSKDLLKNRKSLISDFIKLIK